MSLGHISRNRYRECWSLSCIWPCVTPWTTAHQALLSMWFSRQEYWNGLPFSFPGDLPDPGIKLWSCALQVDSLLSEPLGKHIFNQTTNSYLQPLIFHHFPSEQNTPLSTQLLILETMTDCLLLSLCYLTQDHSKSIITSSTPRYSWFIKFFLCSLWPSWSSSHWLFPF